MELGGTQTDQVIEGLCLTQPTPLHPCFLLALRVNKLALLLALEPQGFFYRPLIVSPSLLHSPWILSHKLLLHDTSVCAWPSRLPAPTYSTPLLPIVTIILNVGPHILPTLHLSLGFVLAEVICFIQGWSLSSQCTLFQWGDRNSRLSSKVSCRWDINWHTVSGLNQQVTSTFSTRKLTCCPHPSFWLLTLHCSSESIIISYLFLVCLEHAEVSAFKFINLDLKGIFCERPRFIEIAE